MTENFKQTGATTGELLVILDKDSVNKELDKQFKRVQKTLTAPGFRKGKVPRKVFESMYGAESLYEETLNNLVPEAYEKAVEEAGIEPVTQPRLELTETNKNEDWVVTAHITLAPEVELGEYKNLEVTKQDREVTDEEVDQYLENKREEYAELVVVDRAAEDGDTVVIDYTGTVDGEEFDGGAAMNYSLRLGSGTFIPGFEDQLVGAKPGEEVSVEVTFPEDYGAEELAGAEAVFQTTVHEVKEEQLPEIDDDFAQDVDEDVEDLAELKEKIKGDLEEAKNAAAKDAIENEAIQKAVDNASVEEIPYDMAHEDVHRQMDIYLNNLQSQGISPDLYFQLTGTTEADLHQQFEEGAEDRVKTNLVLQAIVDAEDIQVTDEEKEEEIKALSEQYGLQEETVRQSLTEDMLVHDIRLKKAIDLITETAKETLEPEVEEEADAEEE